MNQGQAADSLWLRPDGRYVHHYVPPGGGTPVADSGAWQAKAGERLLVTLANYVAYSDAETWPVAKPSLRPGYWITYTQRASGGRPALVVSDDAGWAFVRVADTR